MLYLKLLWLVLKVSIDNFSVFTGFSFVTDFLVCSFLHFVYDNLMPLWCLCFMIGLFY